mgnify:CR=1 FL=1
MGKNIAFKVVVVRIQPYPGVFFFFFIKKIPHIVFILVVPGQYDFVFLFASLEADKT